MELSPGAVHVGRVASIPSRALVRTSVRDAARRTSTALPSTSAALLLTGVGLANACRTRHGRRGAPLRGRRQARVGVSGHKEGRSALVVGGGVAGLATAAQLAKEGMEVTLFEKNSEVGGRCQSMQSTKVQGYRWDTGPSLLLLPQKYEDAFKRLGSDIKKELNLKRVDPPYRVTFGDETFVDVDYDPMKMTEQMEKFEPGCTSNYYRFLSVARRMLDMGLERFVDRQFESWPELVDPIGLLPEMILKGWFSIPLINMLFSIDDLLKAWFQDERLRALFSFQTLYVGLTPYNSPGALCLLAGTDLTDGVWYPMGGWKNVKESLAGLANKHGVKIQTDTPVDEVLVSEGRAVGLKLRDGRVENGDVVVVNADTPYAYQKLLEHTPSQAEAPSVAETSEDLDGREYSCGVIAFFWAVDCKVDYLRHHTIFLGTPVEEKKAWEPITEAAQMPERPNFYVHCPTRTDPSAAPEGCESIMVLFPVANMQQMAEAGFTPGKKGELYRGLREQARKTVLKRFKEAGCGDLEKHIVEETVRDPELIGELYNLQHGATFGLSHGLLPWQGGLAMTRPPPRAAEVDGLYFVGAGTRPGNGVPLVLMGAGLTSQLILDDVKAKVKVPS
ncbi:4-didehydrolycopene-forming)) [Durusdinium trenchii]|uniref:4-didehydrolycopene-forming n=1 Tax=Durusdinium trenchii TaxID=1381693 RepID=A0ABP0QMU3_9DINO